MRVCADLAHFRPTLCSSCRDITQLPVHWAALLSYFWTQTYTRGFPHLGCCLGQLRKPKAKKRHSHNHTGESPPSQNSRPD